MKYCLTLFFTLLLGNISYAQKGIEKLSKQKIDSLQHVHIDTILYYRSSCGECEIINPNKKAKINFSNCQTKEGYALTGNFLIYKQHGKNILLTFDCHKSIVVKQLDSCKSIPYFISIIPTLNKRDKAIKEIYKKGENLGPLESDGGFEEAYIYLNKRVQYVSMSDLEKTDNVFKKYFWTKKQIRLLKLIGDDAYRKTN